MLVCILLLSYAVKPSCPVFIFLFLPENDLYSRWDSELIDKEGPSYMPLMSARQGFRAARSLKETNGMRFRRGGRRISCAKM